MSTTRQQPLFWRHQQVAHVTLNFFLITYLLEDEQELSLGMLIRLQRIHNF
jgi:hypothetical protein